MTSNASQPRAPIPRAAQRLWKWFLLPLPLVVVSTIANQVDAVHIAMATPNPWIYMGIPALAFAIIFVMIFGVWHGLRRIKRAVHATSGRACTHCVYNLNGLGDAGVCPECGRPFDITLDRRSWARLSTVF